MYSVILLFIETYIYLIISGEKAAPSVEEISGSAGEKTKHTR